MRRGDVLRRLAGTYQVDVVSPGAQPLFEPLHGQGHAVDFRRVGFADDRVAHAPVPGLGKPVAQSWSRAVNRRWQRNDAAMTRHSKNRD